MQFLKTMWHVLFGHKYTTYIEFFHYLLDFLKNDYIKFKVSQIYLKEAKIIQDAMSIHYQNN
jgi:hypothetical protein